MDLRQIIREQLAQLELLRVSGGLSARDRERKARLEAELEKLEREET